jgi:hypothetical protein
MHVTTFRAFGSLNCSRRKTRRVCRTHYSYLASFTPWWGQDSASYKVRSETQGYRRAVTRGSTKKLTSSLRSAEVSSQSDAGGPWASRLVSTCGSFAQANKLACLEACKTFETQAHIGLSGTIFRRANPVMFFFPLLVCSPHINISHHLANRYVPIVQHT